MQDSTTVQSVTAAIDHFAAKLQIPAAQVWRTLQVQARIEFYKSLVWVVVWVVFALGVAELWRLAFRSLSRENPSRSHNYQEDWTDHPEWALPLGMASVLAIIALIISVGFLADGVGFLLNPDYYALTRIAKVFR